MALSNDESVVQAVKDAADIIEVVGEIVSLEPELQAGGDLCLNR